MNRGRGHHGCKCGHRQADRALSLAAAEIRLSWPRETADALEAVAQGRRRSATHVVTADVTRARRRRAGFATRRSAYSITFDVWINNAGKGILRPVLELTDEDLDEMIDVNVKSALYGNAGDRAAFHGPARARPHREYLVVSRTRAGFCAPRVPRTARRKKRRSNTLTANLRVDLQRTPPGHSCHRRDARPREHRFSQTTRAAARGQSLPDRSDRR